MNDTTEAILGALGPMLHSRLGNYIVPGLTSYLVGGGEHGKLRLFSTDRETLEFITPHSHRFDFTCLVLAGCAANTIFTRGSDAAEEWCESTIDQVCGADGLMDYVHTRKDQPSYWLRTTRNYSVGDTYSMTHDQIHSIKFGRGARVLFFEGPQKTAQGVMLEPWVDGKCIPTFRTEPWMFERGAQTVTTEPT